MQDLRTKSGPAPSSVQHLGAQQMLAGQRVDEWAKLTGLLSQQP